MGAFRLSVTYYKAGEFWKSLPNSLFKPGDNLQRNNMSATLESCSNLFLGSLEIDPISSLCKGSY